MLAVISVNGQVLKGLEKYAYNYSQVDSLDGPVKEAIMVSLSPIGAENYLSELTSIEAAMCIEEKDQKKFLKAARKVIKNEKIPLTQSFKEEGMVMEFYAHQGEIILLTITEDFVGISVFK